MNEKIRKLWTKYDNSAALPDEWQNKVRRDCLTALDEFAAAEKDAEWFYMKGFLHYMNNPSELAEAHEFFEKALALAPSHGHARLYNGHGLYDAGDYRAAEENFSLVDFTEFDADVRDLMQMKTEEMLVCCRLRLTDADKKALAAARRLIGKYFKQDYLGDYLFNLSRALADYGFELADLELKNLAFRAATRDDLPEIVRMLADDFLGAQRERYENPLPESYLQAFAEIEADRNNELIVAVLDEKIVGTLQITFTPSLSFQGGKRATVESVRVDAPFRGRGIGKELMLFAIDRAKSENCLSVQLTTNADRPEAPRFYETLGFQGTHLGMKLSL